MNEKIIPFSPKNGRIGCMVGKEIKVTENVLLESVKFYITGYGKPRSNYKYGLSSFTGKNDSINLIAEYLSFKNQTKGEAWVENKLKKPLRLQPGRYLIFMKWVIPPVDDGKNTQAIGLLESERCFDTNWMNWSGSNDDWHKDTGPYNGEFMIESVYSEMVR